MAKDMDTKDDIPLFPLHPTISAVSGLNQEKGDGITPRQAEPWDTANTMKDTDKVQSHGHLVVARPVSSGDPETLVGKSVAIIPTDEEKQLGVFRNLTHILWKWGIETHGCVLHVFAYLTL